MSTERDKQTAVKLLTIAQAAEQLNCSPANVRSLVDKGLLAVVPTGANGAGLRVEQSEIERFIEARREFRGTNKMPKPEKMIKLKHFKIRQ